MDIFEAIRMFHSPKRWLTGNLSPEETLQIKASLERFREAERVAGNPETYQTLNAKEGREIALLALELYDARSEAEAIEYLPHIILTNLANGVPGSLEGLYPRLLEYDLGWTSNAMFREADPASCEQIIALLESGEQSPYSREDLLCALAWIGDERVQQQFLRWKQAPPAWSKALYAPPNEYTYEAGWKLTPEGEKRDLYYQANYDLTNLIDSDEVIGISKPASIPTLIDEQCGWCGRKLLSLLDVDLSDPRMAFLGIQGEHLRMTLCLNCSPQNHRVFTEINGYGEVRWSHANGECPAHFHIYDEEYFYASSFAHYQFILGRARRTPYVNEGSHVGGCPNWVQNAEFPRCPFCQQTMIFIAQFEPYHIPYLEGIFYFFLCTSCSLAATGYQQT